MMTNTTSRPNGHADATNPRALLRRIAPSVPLSLDLQQDDGSVLHVELRLAFDCNAIAAAEEASGLNMLKGDIWLDLTGRVLGILFWAALLAHQPEYAGPDGLAVARSYIDAGNILQVGRAVEDAFALSLPAEDRATIRALRERPTAPTTGTENVPASAGSNSGPSPDMIFTSPTPNSAQ